MRAGCVFLVSFVAWLSLYKGVLLYSNLSVTANCPFVLISDEEYTFIKQLKSCFKGFLMLYPNQK